MSMDPRDCRLNFFMLCDSTIPDDISWDIDDRDKTGVWLDFIDLSFSACPEYSAYVTPQSNDLDYLYTDINNDVFVTPQLQDGILVDVSDISIQTNIKPNTSDVIPYYNNILVTPERSSGIDICLDSNTIDTQVYKNTITVVNNKIVLDAPEKKNITLNGWL